MYTRTALESGATMNSGVPHQCQLALPDLFLRPERPTLSAQAAGLGIEHVNSGLKGRLGDRDESAFQAEDS